MAAGVDTALQDPLRDRPPMLLTLAPHPLLDLRAFVTRFPAPLGELPPHESARSFLASSAAAPLQAGDDVRAAVRELLRWGGFRPAGRSKPASEYLLRAAAEGTLAAVNPAVDVCNAVSLHSGLPISVVDLDLAQAPFRVAVAPEGASYVFNPSGQVIDLGGLLCLWDAAGPCANAVRDAQRTKTSPATRRTLSLIWGTNQLPGRTDAALRWYVELLAACGAVIESAELG